jgi:hypothetical protein
MHALKHEWKVALDYYKKSINVTKDFAGAAYRIGRINAQIGNVAQAKAWLKKAGMRALLMKQ